MKIKLLVTALFIVFNFTSLFAQTPKEILKANLANISIPNKDIKSFCFDLTISSLGYDYLTQIRYEKGKIAFNCFDKDKTPIVAARNSDIILNDTLNNRICLFQKNIIILNVTYEDQQLNANFNFHQPTEQEKESTIKVDFLDLAEQGNQNMKATENDGLTIVTGETSKNSSVVTTIDRKSKFPLKKLVIEGEGFKITFDNIKINEPTKEEYYIYPEALIERSGLKAVNLTVDNLIESVQMLQTIMVSIMARDAIRDKNLQETLEMQLGKKLDWPTLKASDLIRSSKLKAVFKQF